MALERSYARDVLRIVMNEFLGTMAQLHGIVAGVYMANGPTGRRSWAKACCSGRICQKLSSIKVKAPHFNSCHFKEFTVNFNDTKKTVADINKALLDHKCLAERTCRRTSQSSGKRFSVLLRFTAKTSMNWRSLVRLGKVIEEGIDRGERRLRKFHQARWDSRYLSFPFRDEEASSLRLQKKKLKRQ